MTRLPRLADSPFSLSLFAGLMLAATCCGPATAQGKQAAKVRPTSQALEMGPQVRQFIDEMSSDHAFDRTELHKLLRQAKTQQSILDAISRPAERVVPWYEYRLQFLNATRIQRGTEFWRTQQALLAPLEDPVLAETIAGILGVETSYGRIVGRYRVLDALATLAFSYPPRADFFRKELQQFLILSREEAVDPRKAQGSYAGAMGIPQFMPSSYRNFAVDADGDSHRDLWQNWADVVGSVANYLRQHGWRANEPVLAEATLENPDLTRFDTSTLALNETVRSLRDKGVRFDTSLPPEAPAMLVLAQAENGPLYRVGFTNFYAITRYNRSTLYAMAVHELGAALREQP